MIKSNVVGIDLGTSFSSIARLDSFGRPEVLANAEGEQMTPSVIYYGQDGILIGKEALKSGSEDPERLVENAKRVLGSSTVWRIDGEVRTPFESAVHILNKLKTEAEEQIGAIDGAVISVPVHFNIQQRKLTLKAAQRIGLKMLGLVNEPVAAALTFILGEHGLVYATLADEQTILVYDLGGGTFDLSIVHYSDQGIEVKAAAGDMKLGGIDWNKRLIDLIAQRFWDKRGYDIRRDPKMLRRLSDNIEESKRSLSNPKKPWSNVTIRYEGYNESFKITREEFEEVSRDLVERTRVLTDNLVRSSVRRWDLLNQVLPVGGATRMPMIREAIRQMCLKTMGEVFGLEPNYRLSPDVAIAQGAALYAGLLAGDGPDGTEWAKRTYVPKMISSRGLGLAVRDDTGERVNHILIPSGSTLPTTVSVGVETVSDNQERISLKIVEAEDQQFREEDILLRCEIADLPANLPEGSAFDVELTCETNGLLQVVARHRETGLMATARLKRDPDQTGLPVEDLGDDDESLEDAVVPNATVQALPTTNGSDTELEVPAFHFNAHAAQPVADNTTETFAIAPIMFEETSPAHEIDQQVMHQHESTEVLPVLDLIHLDGDDASQDESATAAWDQLADEAAPGLSPDSHSLKNGDQTDQLPPSRWTDHAVDDLTEQIIDLEDVAMPPLPPPDDQPIELDLLPEDSLELVGVDGDPPPLPLPDEDPIDLELIEEDSLELVGVDGDLPPLPLPDEMPLPIESLPEEAPLLNLDDDLELLPLDDEPPKKQPPKKEGRGPSRR